ncbi:Spy/CpxP family protein refolding chaperone [Acidiphilium sp.]|uniref:Spy/CpxP family protein refolding chaperone n=1 Tax=Acidiphilium sp. TaxID=527 RepID=UPI003D055642
MNRTMNWRKYVTSGAAAILLAGTASVASAQTPAAQTPAAGPAQGGYGPGMMGGGYGAGMMGGFGPGSRDRGFGAQSVATKLGALKQELKITTEQTPAWNSYAAAVSGADQSLWTTMRSMMQPGTISRVTPEDRFTIMGKVIALQKRRFDTDKAAAAALLPHLSPYQRGQASEILPGLATGGFSMSGDGMMGGSDVGRYGMGPEMMGTGQYPAHP